MRIATTPPDVSWGGLSVCCVHLSVYSRHTGRVFCEKNHKFILIPFFHDTTLTKSIFNSTSRKKRSLSAPLSFLGKIIPLLFFHNRCKNFYTPSYIGRFSQRTDRNFIILMSHFFYNTIPHSSLILV